MTARSLGCRRGWAALALACLLPAGLVACASAGASVGLSIPVGPNTGVGISVDSSGRLSTGVGVSVGGGGVGGQVGVGGSVQLPTGKAREAPVNRYPE